MGRTYVCVGQEMPRAFGTGGGSWDALEFGWDAWEFRCDTGTPLRRVGVKQCEEWEPGGGVRLAVRIIERAESRAYPAHRERLGVTRRPRSL